MKLIIISLLSLILLTSCGDDTITNSNDYNKFLVATDSNELNDSDLLFWNKRIKNDSLQLIALAKSAQENSSLFKKTANIKHLKNAEALLLKATSIAAIDKNSYLQSLAHNYITQHRFKEAKELLMLAYSISGETNDIHLMLFDVCLELGQYKEAEAHLAKTENFADFNYLTRLAKWKDYKGDLDATIHYMEKALEIAVNTNKKDIKVWMYTNLADYYGHAGRIKDSYDFYLKTLAIEPTNAYAKKGIAWITYSYENNPVEALRILNTIDGNNQSPHYHLLKAEIAEYQQDDNLKNQEIQAYLKESSKQPYGVMYNSYTANVLAEETTNHMKALELAKQEVAQRPTPQSYDLMAYIYYLKGEHKKALEIASKHVVNQTYEPTAQLHIAQIYKANNMIAEAKEIKEELLEAKYELGPLAYKQIRNL